MASPAFTVLVVDESSSASRFVDLAIGPDGVRVVGATDGHAALKEVDRVRPDVALVAMGMAGPDGWRISDQLASRNVAVVLMSGSFGPDPASARPGVPIIRKPLQVQQLRDLVARMSGDTPVVSVLAEMVAPPAIQLTAEAEPTDPVDAWLQEADEALFGGAPPRLRRLSIDGAALSPFAHDLKAFRAAPPPAGLQFSRHRTSY